MKYPRFRNPLELLYDKLLKYFTSFSIRFGECLYYYDIRIDSEDISYVTAACGVENIKWIYDRMSERFMTD